MAALLYDDAAARSHVSLFQRIRTPFGEMPEGDMDQPQRRAHAVGELLHERRRELSLDLDSVSDALRIKPLYLAAIEQGRTQDLPGPTYAIGFVRTYAHYLGFDSERVLDTYKAESAEVHARPDLTFPVPLGARSLPGGPILLVGLILALCGYGTWYYLATGDRSRPERVAAVPMELQQSAGQGTAQGTASTPSMGAAATANKPSPPAAPAVTAAPTLGSGLVTPAMPAADPASAATGPPPVSGSATPGTSPSPAPTTAPATAVAAVIDGARNPTGNTAGSTTGNIDIRAVADCWIQIRGADQSIVFSRVLKAGETYRVPRTGLFLRTGNAGALTVLVDGKQAPALGTVGMLRRNVALEPEALLAGTAVRG